MFKRLRKSSTSTIVLLALLLMSMFGVLIPLVHATTIFSDGFENGFSAWTGATTSGGTISVSSSYAYQGTYSAQTNVDTNGGYAVEYYNSGSSYTGLYISCYMYVTSLPSSGIVYIPCSLNSQANGAIAQVIYNCATDEWGVLLTTTTNTFYYQTGTSELSLNTWFSVELSFQVSSSAGELQLLINGNEIVSETGLNTGSNNINKWWVGCGFETGTSAQLTFYVDNVVVGQGNVGPAYSNLAVSTTKTGASAIFSVDVTGNGGLSTWVFGSNNTGTFVNQTGSFSTNPSWVNITQTNNAAVGNVITYEFWFDDTSNNWANTGSNSFIITAANAISAINAASASISTSGYLAENMVYDSATNLYWWVFTNIGSTYHAIDIAYSSGPSGPWTVQSTPLVSGASNSVTSDSIVDAPCLIKFGSTWYLYYSCALGETANNNNNIYVQTSSYVNQGFSGSGITNPILTNGSPGTWDSLRVQEPDLILVGSTYYMFFMGQNGTTSSTDPTTYELCGYATSSSPTSGFTVWSGNPITPANVIHNGGYDAANCKGADPWIIKIGSTYYLGVTGSTASLNYPYDTLLYTTTNFATFTYDGFLLGPSGGSNWDADGAFRGAVSDFGGTYYFPYTGVDSGGNYRMGETTLTVPSNIIPTVSVSPSSWTMDVGQSKTLTATASGGSGTYTSYQWYVNGVAQSSATASTFSYSPVSAGSYSITVTVTDSFGATSAQSSPATVTVNSALAAPTVTASPTTVNQGQISSLTSIAVSTGTSPYTYQWLQKAPGGSYVDVGTNSASYSFVTSGSTATGVWSFELQVTDSTGAVVTSSVATVTVNISNVPTVSVSPTSWTMDVGQSKTFTASASGGSGTYASYQWYVNGVAQSGQTASTFNYSPVSAGTYSITVTVTDSSGATSAQSSPAMATVNSALAAPTVSASKGTVDRGQTSSLTSTAVTTGASPYTYQWLEKAPGATSYTAITGATSTTYSFATTGSTTTGAYSFELRVTDSTGAVVTSSAVTVTVHTALVAPTVTANPTTIHRGQTSALSSSTVSTGSGSYTYQWLEKAPGATSYTAITGATSTTYSFATTGSTTTGAYSFELRVTDSTGAVVTSSAVTVTVERAAR